MTYHERRLGRFADVPIARGKIGAMGMNGLPDMFLPYVYRGTGRDEHPEWDMAHVEVKPVPKPKAKSRKNKPKPYGAVDIREGKRIAKIKRGSAARRLAKWAEEREVKPGPRNGRLSPSRLT